MKKSILFLTVFFISLMANAQPGSLDNTFDSDGKVTTAIGDSNDYSWSVAIQTDGKILVSGYSWNGTDNDFALVRYNTDGSLDNTFDTDGKVTTPIGSSDDYGALIAIQTDGKILAAGNIWNGTDRDFAIMRYNTDGSLDNSFDSDGKQTTAIGIADDYGMSIAIQSDGKILVAGQIYNGTDYDFAIVRYNTDGSLDNTFDSDGIVTTAIGSADDYGLLVDIQIDGKILVNGSSWNGSDYDFALVRYNTNGSLDSTFDLDGKLITDFGGPNDYGYSVNIQTDSKILVAGFSYNGANNDFALVRYNSDGSLDNTFDTDGKLTTAIGDSTDYGYSVAIQTDGKILVAGESNNGVDYDFALVRYNTDGSLDNTFDTDGKLTTAIGSGNDDGWSVTIQGDGKILVAGYSWNGTDYDFALVRYNIGYIGIEEESIGQLAVNIYPNPFTQSTTLEIKDAELIMQDVELKIYDVVGRIVHQQILNSKIETLNLNLPGGTYFYKIIKEKKGLVGCGGKLIIQ